MAEIHKDIIMFRSSREINENLHLKMTKEEKKTKRERRERQQISVFHIFSFVFETQLEKYTRYGYSEQFCEIRLCGSL